jgi:diadenosine tetraphosphate (Ap4A) HIT family hydrolase
MSCPFCEISAIKTRILKEGKYHFVCLSNPRLVPGHLLVVPKRHVEKVSELTDQERKEIFKAIINLEEEILKKLASGCDIRTHYRPFIKQGWIKVNHLHFHLQPREFEDELYQKSQKYEKDLWKDLPKEEEEKFTKLFGG